MTRHSYTLNFLDDPGYHVDSWNNGGDRLIIGIEGQDRNGLQIHLSPEQAKALVADLAYVVTESLGKVRENINRDTLCGPQKEA